MTHILAAAILHEANSFARTAAPISHFERQGIFRGEAVQARFGQTRTEMAGFLAAAKTHGWRITTPIAVPCAPAGPMSMQAFALFRDTLLDGVRDAGPLDGVLLALHGANVADGELDPDGAIAGEIDPQLHLARGWQMRGFDSCRTTPPDGPMRQALAIARRMEQQPGVIEVSIQSGFVLADVWHVGPSVAVTADGRNRRFTALARELMQFGWQQRHNDTVPMISVAEAFAQARAVPPGPGPIVISDFGDAPGAGGYGDATAVLRALLADPFPDSLFLAIADAGAVQQAIAAGIGATLPLSLGGHAAPEHGGGPIEDDFTVLSSNDGRFVHEGSYTPGMIGNFGPSVLLACRGVRIAVTTFQRSIVDLSQLRLFGIDPTKCGLIAIKCMDAFRAAFTPIARTVIACESGGVSSRVQTSLAWTRARRPIWPLYPDDEVEAAMNRTVESLL
jgi:microcystin degradation protein MlrC